MTKIAITSKTEQALLRAIGNASQAADELRAQANKPKWDGQFHDAIASFVLAAAQVRNRYHEYENV